MKKSKLVELIAINDVITNDNLYNNGLRLILRYGYLNMCGHPDVQYWCECNNI